MFPTNSELEKLISVMNVKINKWGSKEFDLGVKLNENDTKPSFTLRGLRVADKKDGGVFISGPSSRYTNKSTGETEYFNHAYLDTKFQNILFDKLTDVSLEDKKNETLNYDDVKYDEINDLDDIRL